MADGRDSGRRNEGADAGDCHEPLAQVRVIRPDRQLVGGGLDLAVNGEPPLAQPMEDIE